MWSLGGGFEAMTPSRYKWIVVIIAMFTTFIMIDLGMVAVALARITKHFDVSLSHTQWIITGYSLATGMALPSAGYLADRFGMKRVLLAACAIYSIFAAASGVAQNLDLLITFRILQGIGNGIITPLTLVLVFRIVPDEERGKFWGIVWGPSMVVIAMSTFFGGVLTEHVSWRALFYVDVLIGVVPFFLALVFLREQKFPTRETFDLPGLAFAAAGFGLLLYALSKAPTDGWGDPLIITTLLGSLASLIIFVTVALRTRYPIVDLRLFVQRAFVTNNAVIWVSAIGVVGASFLAPLFMQQLQGRGPMETGAIMVPGGLAMGISFAFGGWLYDRWGARYPTAAGALILAIGCALFATWEVGTNWWPLTWMYFVQGIGLGLVSVPGVAAVQEVIARDMARANALFQSTRVVASSLAVALLTTWLVERTPVLMDRGQRGLEPGSTAYFVAARDAGVFTFHEAFLIMATVSFLCIFVALILRSGRPPKLEAGSAPAAEP